MASLAPSAILSATWILNLLSFANFNRNYFPSSDEFPLSLTTRGTLTLTNYAALAIPSAIVLQLKIPPKIFTKMHLTDGCEDNISKAILHYSTEAPPPTSRKLAGSSP